MLAGLVAATLAAAAQGDAASCQQALGPLYGGTEESALADVVDGATIRGRDGLVALRSARGNALIVVRGGDFQRADLRRRRLHNICFIETNFSGSDWRGARAEGVGFIRANLSGANLVGARMPGVLFRAPDLKNVDASTADFSGGKLDGGWDASAENWRLVRANLTGFNFDCGITIDNGCPLDGTLDLSGANLTQARIFGYNRVTNWTGARIDRTEVDLGQLADLATAGIAGPIVVRGDEATAELSAAELGALLPNIGLNGQARSPSFDCAAVSVPAERTICAADNGRLRQLDRDVADLYNQALARDPDEAARQREWLAVRNRCAEADCVRQSYEDRRAALVARIGPPTWLRPGRVALMVAPTISFEPAFRSTPLYARLVPVIIGSSGSRVVVRVRADGSIDARGDAIGGNAHSCSLGGERLQIDPATGWFSGPIAAAGRGSARARSRRMPVLMFWNDWVEVYRGGHADFGTGGDQPQSSDYASCGARAGFDEMLRMSVPDAEASRVFESIGEP